MADPVGSPVTTPWSQRLPVLRLFNTFTHAIDFRHMLLAFAAVLVIYLYGRVLDGIWLAAGAGVETPVVDVTEPGGELEVVQRGPFSALLEYESNCFGGAVRGVLTLNWGLSGDVGSDEPSMGGSILGAGRGVVALVTQRPWYALLLLGGALLCFAYFGAAICRSMAVKLGRDRSIEISDALRFAGEKYPALLLAPVFPGLVLVGGAVVLVIGGLVGAIPVVGEILTGLLFGLALLAGFALAIVLIAFVLGGCLLWPRIAAEGSDAFDGVQAFGYVGQRPWSFALYGFVLLLYGAVCFTVVRLIALLLLMFTHSFAGAGMSLFGSLSSARTEDVLKLDAIWRMPTWADMPLLPAVGGVPYYGTFGAAPLSWSEAVAMWLMAAWVFCVVGLVAAFIVSFYFCASTQIYFLLRKEVDAVDYEEVFYEDDEDELLAAATGDDGIESHGTALPVVPSPQEAAGPSEKS